MVAAAFVGVLTTGATLLVDWPTPNSAADSTTGGSAAGRSVDAELPSTGREPAPGAAVRQGRDEERRTDDRSTPAPDDRADGVSRSGGRSEGAAPEPDWLAACGSDDQLLGYDNGVLPEDELCALPANGQQLRPSAAKALWRLDSRYQQEFGSPLCVTDGYRSLAQQEDLAVSKPGLAARPGTSNHGWASALDLCGGVETFGTAEHEWLRAHAGTWGWENPPWAHADGSKPEPWHWEYVGSA